MRRGRHLRAAQAGRAPSADQPAALVSGVSAKREAASRAAVETTFVPLKCSGRSARTGRREGQKGRYNVRGKDGMGGLTATDWLPHMPPVPLPWPPSHVVREVTMISAPKSKHLVRYDAEGAVHDEGHVVVGATLEMASKSQISRAGLDTDSQATGAGLVINGGPMFSGSFMSTNLTVIPRVGRMSLNCV